VTGPLIAPVIPSSAAARPARAPAAARTLPLTVPPVRPPALPRDVLYGLARVDRSGRVADRTVTGALGWRGGDRLTLGTSPSMTRIAPLKAPGWRPTHRLRASTTAIRATITGRSTPSATSSAISTPARCPAIRAGHLPAGNDPETATAES